MWYFNDVDATKALKSRVILYKPGKRLTLYSLHRVPVCPGTILQCPVPAERERGHCCPSCGRMATFPTRFPSTMVIHRTFSLFFFFFFAPRTHFEWTFFFFWLVQARVTDKHKPYFKVFFVKTVVWVCFRCTEWLLLSCLKLSLGKTGSLLFRGGGGGEGLRFVWGTSELLPQRQYRVLSATSTKKLEREFP